MSYDLSVTKKVLCSDRHHKIIGGNVAFRAPKEEEFLLVSNCPKCGEVIKQSFLLTSDVPEKTIFLDCYICKLKVHVKVQHG